jgi:hypothetical protein
MLVRARFAAVVIEISTISVYGLQILTTALVDVGQNHFEDIDVPRR